MSGFEDRAQLARSIWRTWGARGLVRRSIYEADKRFGRLTRAERRWLDTDPGPLTLSPLAGIGRPELPTNGSVPPDTVRLYGYYDTGLVPPIDWHVNPTSGHRYRSDVHWSELSDSGQTGGDIKDIWELGRLGWLDPTLCRIDDAGGEVVWAAIEHFVAENPPYLGPQWMCGQETSLRAIRVMFLHEALRTDPATTDQRRDLAARLVWDSIGRVLPTLGYAQSQRNNHAISEAGFLWTATLVLGAGRADLDRIRAKAARALTEAVDDQFSADGSYAQHSPTYQRLALHVLLWCLAVARDLGVEPPPGVRDAVSRSVWFLRSLVAPGSDGRVPNLGGNDGALLFDLVDTDIGDFRPVISHAASATSQNSGVSKGPWDDEARWFGWGPTSAEGRPVHTQPTSIRALTVKQTHAVLRAGPLHHRPAHADQLHLDVWLDGNPVAVDPGSYRYSAPEPWGNALAGESVHNLPTRKGSPQAVQAGRFFWSRWTEASVHDVLHDDDTRGVEARMVLPDGTELRRLVAVFDGLIVVSDHASSPVKVRWNLIPPVVQSEDSATHIAGSGWHAAFRHGDGGRSLDPSDADPRSGWHAPTYARKLPLTALLLPSDREGRVLSLFTSGSSGWDLDAVAEAATGSAGLPQITRAISDLRDSR